MILFRYHLFLPLAFLAAGEVCAQKGPAGVAGKNGTTDPGVRVEMFESANLDRFIRSAQASLAKEDYEHAIKVLQEVIEGRTGEFMAEAKKAGPPADVVRPAKTVVDPKAVPPDSGVIDEEDPATWRRILEVNLTSAYLCTRQVVGGMRNIGGGKIVNIS